MAKSERTVKKEAKQAAEKNGHRVHNFMSESGRPQHWITFCLNCGAVLYATTDPSKEDKHFSGPATTKDCQVFKKD